MSNIAIVAQTSFWSGNIRLWISVPTTSVCGQVHLRMQSVSSSFGPIQKFTTHSPNAVLDLRLVLLVQQLQLVPRLCGLNGQRHLTRRNGSFGHSQTRMSAFCLVVCSCCFWGGFGVPPSSDFHPTAKVLRFNALAHRI